MVKNVMAMETTSTSVQVSWDKLNLTGITGYIVYYVINETNETEESFTVSNSSNNATITKLINGMEYKFEVAATAGNESIGERSSPVVILLTGL